MEPRKVININYIVFIKGTQLYVQFIKGKFDFFMLRCDS